MRILTNIKIDTKYLGSLQIQVKPFTGYLVEINLYFTIVLMNTDII